MSNFYSNYMFPPHGFCGQIELIIGPMFSGKSTELIRRVKRYNAARKRVAIIKFHADKRYSEDCVSTHDKTMIKAFSCSKLAHAVEKVKGTDVIAIDEGQFFEDLREFAESQANDGKIVVVAALDATYQRSPFKQVTELIPRAEQVVKLSAVCSRCPRSAAFSARLIDQEGEVVIGSDDMYQAVCRQCYFQIEKEKAARKAAQTQFHPFPIRDEEMCFRGKVGGMSQELFSTVEE